MRVRLMNSKKTRVSRHLLGLLALSAACNQQQGGIENPTPRVDRVHVESQHVDYDMASTAEGTEIRSTIPYPARDVWEAAQRVFADLGIAPEILDPTRRFLAGSASARRVFASRALSQLVNCGSTLMGPNADTYNARLHLQTEVDSTGAAESQVRTILQTAAASDGGSTVQCSTKGVLERTIRDRISALLIQQKT
jgi:hypothetical protein